MYIYGIHTPSKRCTGRHAQWPHWCQGRNRKIFLRGQSHFPDFFPTWNVFLPVGNFHFGRPKTNFSGFEKWKERGGEKKKKKKKSSPHFVTFPSSTFLFTIFLLFFSIFTPFPFFLASFFPVGQQKFPGHKSWGILQPPPPLRHWLMPLPTLKCIPVDRFLGNAPFYRARKNVMWSSKKSLNSQILFFRYSQTKPIVSFVSYCLFNPSTVCIFGTSCPISVGFSPN